MLIGEGGERIGVVPLQRALQFAQEKGLDLVEVAPQQNPPVCRIMDYGKYKYEQAKKEQKAKKSQKGMAEVRISPKIKENDLLSKARLVQRLLEEGKKVKVSIVFHGREISHPELGWKVLQQLALSLKGIAGVEKPPTMEEEEGNLTVIFTALKKEVKVAKTQNS